jgi:diguanylate cyclase (GGDEF)-like protein
LFLLNAGNGTETAAEARIWRDALRQSREILNFVTTLSVPSWNSSRSDVIQGESNHRGEPDLRILSAEQSRELLDVRRHVAGSGPSGVMRRCASMLSEVFKAKVAFVTRRRGRWAVLAESTIEPRLPESPAAWESFGAVATAAASLPSAWADAENDWTVVSLKGRSAPAVLLVIQGDWTMSAAALTRLAENLRPGSRAAARSQQRRAGLAAHRLARALGRADGLDEVCSVLLDHIVRAVPSRLAAVALPDEDDQLSVVATRGYPQSIVDHVRIPMGSGVIGSVYRNGVPLHVADVARFPGLQRRPRYRTNSFVAVPITAGSKVLGVVCVTDRLDDRSFTQGDLSMLSALTAPAALALAREGAKRQAQTFAHAAVVDPVSGLFNRRYFQHRLHEELQRAQRHKMPVALLMIDIDDFKAINDRYGHLTGDIIIRDVSDILRKAVRVFDICTRYGGEEFAVVMPGSGVENAGNIAERIRQRIEAHRLEEGDLAAMRVTVSVGVSISNDGSARSLIERADLALYAAKREGKNRVKTVTE